MSKKNNVIISGGFGYIGSSLLETLLNKKYNIGIISRTIPMNFSGDSEVYLHDITQPISVSLNKNYDIFIHLAAANDIDSKNPKTALLNTTYGTMNCLEFCVKNNITKFIYFSTYQIYGKTDNNISETSLLTPISNYGITHMFAEEYIKMYNRQNKIDYVILRVANIFGSPVNLGIDRWSLVPNCFCREIYETQKITLFSSGKQQLDFVSLNDLSEITGILVKKFSHYTNTVFNISSGFTYSIISLAEMVKKIYESRFNKKAVIEIKSQISEKVQKICFDRNTVSRLDYRFDSSQGKFELEINKIFDLF